MSREDDDTPPERIANPGAYHLRGALHKPKEPLVRDEDLQEPSRENGTGKTDLNKVKDEEIARLKAALAERNSDTSFGETLRHGKRIAGWITAAVSLCGLLFTGLAWYTSSAINTAVAQERLKTQDRIEAIVENRMQSAHFASAESVAVLSQKLTDVELQLTRIEHKLDALLLRPRTR